MCCSVFVKFSLMCVMWMRILLVVGVGCLIMMGCRMEGLLICLIWMVCMLFMEIFCLKRGCLFWGDE